jgi:iron complex outermembrane receptor protein
MPCSRGGAAPIRRSLWALALLLAGAPAPALDQSRGDLTELSLEELMALEVTLAAKIEQPLFQTAGAIYVVTREDIRRSGATSIPEALRMVPGLHVARLGSSKWAVSARGFTDLYSNKLLVLIDGRSVYTPLFAGVFWDAQDVLLEDIDRIEVVRGPGATLWGANAVNGVINIVTRSSRQTEGAFVTAGGGSEERALGAARVGGSLGAHASYRGWAKYTDRDASVDSDGRAAADSWDVLHGGFRVDWEPPGADRLTLQGDLYGADVGEITNLAKTAPPFVAVRQDVRRVSGGHLLGQWNRAFSERSDAHLQVYYDRTDREDTGERRDTFDVELQHDLALGRHGLVWGLGYRHTRDRLPVSDVSRFDPGGRSDELFSGFLQGEVEAGSGLRLVLGAKLEHNDYSGFAFQPNARLAYSPSERQVVWAAVSRALRTPSRGEHDLRFSAAAFPGPDGVVNVVRILGNPGFGAEELTAWELGYRWQAGAALAFDLSAFHNDYARLRTLEPGAAFQDFESGQPIVVLPQRVANLMAGSASGVELAANWQATDAWRLGAAYSHLSVDLKAAPGSLDPAAEAAEGDAPRNQLHLRSFLDLPWGLELDATLYRSDDLPNRGIPSYTRLDVMLGWFPTQSLELRLALQNALDPRHAEFGRNIGVGRASEVERSLWARLTWRF